jgi:hypothetical protein
LAKATWCFVFVFVILFSRLKTTRSDESESEAAGFCETPECAFYSRIFQENRKKKGKSGVRI